MGRIFFVLPRVALFWTSADVSNCFPGSALDRRMAFVALFEDFFWKADTILKKSRAKTWAPQDISNFMWAFAALRCECEPPVDVLLTRAGHLKWPSFAPQEMSIMMWAAMTIGITGRWPPARVSANMCRCGYVCLVSVVSE